MHDPFGHAQDDRKDIFGTGNSSGQLVTDNAFFSGFDNGTGAKPLPASNDMNDFFDSMPGNQNQGANTGALGSSDALNAALFNEDDILKTLGAGGAQPAANTAQPVAGFDQIFQATAQSSSSGMFSTQAQGQGFQNKAPPPPRYGSYDSQQSTQNTEDALRGRNLASEAISSEKKRTLFQRYVFDSYKYQAYFNTSTLEILEKLSNAMWPFYPES